MDEGNGDTHELIDALIRRGSEHFEGACATGVYSVFARRGAKILWRDQMPNLVTTVGKNLELDTYLSGAGYTVTGPYLGLISSSGFGVTTKDDTLVQHRGWNEAGKTHAPTYEGMRKLMGFHAAADGSKALLSPLQFTFTSDGFVEGCFMVLGPRAEPGIDTTGGTLHSAGVFVVGRREVKKGDSLFVNYAYRI